MDDGLPDVGDAALALAAAAVDAARIPLALAARLPGARMLARDGALVRGRARSRVEGLASGAIDRVLAGPLTDAVIRSLAEHHVAERLAAARASDHADGTEEV